MALPLRDDRSAKQVPWLTIALIVVNVAVFLFVQPPGFQSVVDRAGEEQEWLVRDHDEFSYRWGAVPCEVVSGDQVVDEPSGCDAPASDYLPAEKSVVLSLLTAMFLHASIDHLAGNMLFLWVFGKAVEERLGRGNFLGLYVIGGVVATLGFTAVHVRSANPLIGASGAIAVAMGAYLFLFPRGRILTVTAPVPLQIAYVPAVVVLALYFVTQFFTASEEVAWEAHAAGMVAGFIGAMVLSRVPAVRRRAEQDARDAPLRIGQEF